MFKRRNGKPYKLFILAQIIYWLAQQKVQFMKHFLNGLRLNIGVKGKLSARHKGDVTRNDSQRRFLVQNRVQILEQCCSLSQRCSNNVVKLCCAKNRRCKSAHVISP